MSYLTICQDAAQLMGLVAPSAINAANDQQSKQLGAMAKMVAKELADRYDWQQLISEGTITLATSDQDYALASDCLRMVRDTMWDRTNDLKQDFGPGPQEWAFLKGDGVFTTANRRARLIGDLVTFYETITSGDNNDVINYEYITNKLWLNGSTPVESPTVDTYTCRIPERLVTLGVVYRYREAKGMEFSGDRARYEREFARIAGQSSAPKALHFGSPPVPETNVPDRGYGS
jgi:hypothetical protein